MELDIKSLFGLHVQQLYSTHWLKPRNAPLPRIWASILVRFRSAKIDDIFFVTPCL